MNPKIDNLVAEFLLSSIPAQVLGGYKIVAQLKYPVGDKKSFSDQLDELAKQLKEPPGADALHIELVRVAFDVRDFPIQTAQGGLEKLHGILSKSPRSDLPRPIPPELTYVDPRDFYGTPEMPEINNLPIYQKRFGDCAGTCAYRHYLWGVTEGREADYDAFFRGLSVGAECQRTGICPALPNPRRRRGAPAPPLFLCLPFSPPPPF